VNIAISSIAPQRLRAVGGFLGQRFEANRTARPKDWTLVDMSGAARPRCCCPSSTRERCAVIIECSCSTSDRC